MPHAQSWLESAWRPPQIAWRPDATQEKRQAPRGGPLQTLSRREATRGLRDDVCVRVLRQMETNGESPRAGERRVVVDYVRQARCVREANRNGRGGPARVRGARQRRRLVRGREGSRAHQPFGMGRPKSRMQPEGRIEGIEQLLGKSLIFDCAGRHNFSPWKVGSADAAFHVVRCGSSEHLCLLNRFSVHRCDVRCSELSCAIAAKPPEGPNFNHTSCSSARRIGYQFDNLIQTLGFNHREPCKWELVLSIGFICYFKAFIPVPYRCDLCLNRRHKVPSAPYRFVLSKNFASFLFAQRVPAVFVSIGKAQKLHLPILRLKRRPDCLSAVLRC